MNPVRKIASSCATLLAVALFSGPAFAVEADQIQLNASDGTPVSSASGIQVRGYNGSSWIATAGFEGNGIFEFGNGSVTTVRVVKDNISSSSYNLGTEIDLVDFRLDIHSSSYQGGARRSVNQVRLYQNTSWRSAFTYSASDSAYHVDVVDGVDLRAYVIKNDIGTYTETVRPSDSNGTDVSYQLVDFKLEVHSSAYEGSAKRGVNQVRLYQNTSWRSAFTYSASDSSYHADVVDGVDLRAYVIKDNIGAYTATVRPSDTDGTDVSYQLVDFKVDVFASDYQGGAKRSVNQLRLYQNTSWRTSFVYSSSDSTYHADVVDGVDLRAYVIKDNIGAYTVTVRPSDTDGTDVSYELADFRIDVKSSPYSGGNGRNVNQVRLYQNTSWRTTMVQSGNTGEYHADVVRGVDLRGYVILNNIGAYTETCRPADTDGMDVSLQLVDFAIGLETNNCDAISLDQVRLYQNSSWRATFSYSNPVQDLHMDVIPGVALRAYIIKYGIGTFTETVTPVNGDDKDLKVIAPSVTLAVDGGGPAQARLYQGSSWRTTLNIADDGMYHAVLIDGMSNLRFWLDGDYTPTFSVDSTETNLAADALYDINAASSTCWDENNQTAAVELLNLNGNAISSGSVRLEWETAFAADLTGFVIQREGQLVSGLIPASTSTSGASYSWEDEDPLDGTVEYTILQMRLDGSVSSLGSVEVDTDALPQVFGLRGAWPNPFNPSTTIKVQVLEDGPVNLRIYNTHGQLVRTLHQGSLSAGEHEFVFQAGAIASGMYVVALDNGFQRDTMKLLLLK